MERLEAVTDAIKEYERNTNKILSEKEKEIFDYGYSKGYLDNAVTLSGILSKYDK